MQLRHDMRDAFALHSFVVCFDASGQVSGSSFLTASLGHFSFDNKKRECYKNAMLKEKRM